MKNEEQGKNYRGGDHTSTTSPSRPWKAVRRLAVPSLLLNVVLLLVIYSLLSWDPLQGAEERSGVWKKIPRTSARVKTKTMQVDEGTDDGCSGGNKIFGHVHMAKTAGTEINGELAAHFERVCGHKG